MKIHFVFFILLAINFTSHSQTRGNPQADSILNVIRTLKDDSTKVNSLIALGNLYLYSDAADALKYGSMAQNLAERINYVSGQGYSLKLLGQAYASQSNFPEAIVQFKASLLAFESINNKEGESNILNNLGSVYFNMGDDTKSIEYHLKSLKIADELNNKFRISTNLNNIGTVYANHPATIDKALVYYLRALPIFEEIKYSDGIGVTLTNIGEIYFNNNQYDSSLIFFERAIKIYEGTTDVIFPMNYVGEIYAIKNDFEKSLRFHNQAIEISDRLGAKFELVQSLLSLGKSQNKMGELKGAIETNLKALKIAQEIAARQEIKKIYEALSSSFASLRDFNNAYRYEKLSAAIKDTLYNTSEERKIQLLQFNSDAEKKESQVQLQQATIQRQKIIKYAVWIFLFSVLVIGVITIRFFQIRKSNREKRKANKILEDTLHELKATQAQLIQSEKMASLGELTAGIAHEIQNPLNFVNNFSELNKEMIAELRAEIKKGNFEEVDMIAGDIEANEEKILHHGKRAEGIVKGMLQHSRTSTGQRELTDINALADEYLRLSYHGLRAKDKSFMAKFNSDYDPTIKKINIIPQDMGRVILNLINNAFYAVNEKNKQGSSGYVPTVSVSTKNSGTKVLISVKDNGNGIPEAIKEKIFQPFFTTKPTGQGTGLGLSLSYDIVKAHGGELKVETRLGEGSKFVIYLPTYE